MAESLVIVESPAKAKTINRYLGPDYNVMASMGHVRDLPKSKLGVDLANDFAPQYIVIPERRKVVTELKAAAEKAKEIILAADPDREGEAICWHLKAIFEEDGAGKPIGRVLLHEITKPAVELAISHVGPLDLNLFNAQQTRRILDRLVGYQISPVLWKKVGRDHDNVVRVMGDRGGESAGTKAEPADEPQTHLPGCRVPLDHGDLQDIPLHIGHREPVRRFH